ncbi:MAG: aminotransferase [Gammaproteobacteria bacterium]|nr:aminotransferase [Gammaproteobacteria bacterium]MYD76358.1 aminotransferase [Gammaproteobacteria bacterium]MYJ51245.1 aminotransferase [Gammaproteobacteria bacterium]
MTELETTDLQKQDNQFIHPWEELDRLDRNARTVITRGEGVYIEDSDGNRLLDAPAGMWCVNIGHHRQEMADAIAEQVMELTYSSPWSLTNSPASILARKLGELSPGDLNHVFFATCGSTAVDSALRFVMFRNNALGKTEKKHIISRKNAYHGSTFLAASASGKAGDKINLDFKDDTFHHISDPNLLNKPEGMSDAEYCRRLTDELEQKILEIGAERTAAFIAEPVLASGGVLLAPEGYHAACLDVCRRHDVVYISDEVVTGFGRLGHYFASEKVFNIVPDIITCAKGITSGYVPLGAFLVSDRLLSSLAEKNPDSVFSNGFTYSGHPVACAAALKNIEIMEREGILEHAREIEPYFQERLKELSDLPVVREVRGIGLMACIECMDHEVDGKLVADSYELAERIDRHCQSLGLLVRPIYNMCVMSPPLIITRNQIDEMADMLRRGIELALSELSG